MRNYLQCRLPQISSTETVKCDCQKQSPDLSGNSGQPAEEKSPLKQKTEDPFAGSLLSAITYCAIGPVVGKLYVADPSLSAGFAMTIFQPPRS